MFIVKIGSRQSIGAMVKDDLHQTKREQKLSDIESLFMHVPAAVAVVRAPNLVFEFANTCFHAMAGKQRELRGQPLTTVFPDIDNRIVNIMNRVVMSGERHIGKEFPICIDWDGSGEPKPRYFNFNYEPIMGKDDRKRVMIVCFEVTEHVLARQREKKATEESKIANLAKSRYLAGMSHEIRTPLGVILGFADLALDNDASAPDIQKYLKVIKRNGEELSRLIGNILDISKVEAEKVDLENTRFSLSAFLNEIIGSLRVRAREKDIRLILKTHLPIPHLIETDATRLRQILVNMLGNAIKFTNRGHVILECRWTTACVDGVPVGLEFVVSDTGIGLSESQRKNLFQPYSQADCTVNRRYGGTGLGLMLSKQLAGILGGDLVLRSTVPGEGSSFALTIIAGPLEMRQDLRLGLQMSSMHGDVASSRQLQGARILVVEDSLDNQVLVTRFLKSAGAEVEVAHNGAEGILKTQEKSYDVVLMDIQMPILDGLAATSQLREMGYKKPIIALTARAMREEREMATANGFNEYLIKPLDRKNLIENVRKFCQ